MDHDILIIDDDTAIPALVARALQDRPWQLHTASTAQEGLDAFASGRFDLVLLDLQLPDRSGLSVLQSLCAEDPDIAVIMLTGHGDVPTAVDAMRLGAENFLAKPFDMAHLRVLIERALEKVALQRRNRVLAERCADTHRLAALGTAESMRGVTEQVELLAATDFTVLIGGAIGTGKGWTAELIHSLSLRPHGPFMQINCAGLDSAAFQAELFGQEKGSLAPAAPLRRGLVEVAAGGTLLLDEIGELATDLQPQLLSFLDHMRYRRLGGTEDRYADVRLIATSSWDLRELVDAGKFRRDLFYRVSAHSIVLPPLHARGAEAIADLAYRLLDGARRRAARGPSRIAADVLDRFARYPWPGNVRELRNVIEYALIRADGAAEIQTRHLPHELRRTITPLERPGTERGLPEFLASAERRHVLAVLAEVGGNRSRAARELGISRSTLYEKLKLFGVDR